jgi:hypothetical protein
VGWGDHAPLGAWRESEQSPKEVRSFASSLAITLWRRVLRTIAPEGAIVRFLSVYGTLEKGSHTSVCMTLWRKVMQTIAPGGAIVRFLSVYDTLDYERTTQF